MPHAVRALGATLLLTLSFATAALAVSPEVRSACRSDYFKYCSRHALDSKQLRACMRAAGSGLSPTCVKALVGAGEISTVEVRAIARRPGN